MFHFLKETREIESVDNPVPGTDKDAVIPREDRFKLILSSFPSLICLEYDVIPLLPMLTPATWRWYWIRGAMVL